MTREDMINLIRLLPDEKLPEAEAMLRNLLNAGPPFKPTPLGGLWKGVEISEADIAAARKEMWGKFGEDVVA